MRVGCGQREHFRAEICVSWPWNSRPVMLTQYIFICWQSKLHLKDTHLVVDISVRRKNETASLAFLMPIWLPACLYHKHSSIYLYYYYDLGFSRFIWLLNTETHLLMSSLNFRQTLLSVKSRNTPTLRQLWDSVLDRPVENFLKAVSITCKVSADRQIILLWRGQNNCLLESQNFF